jgi:hypothetical protein
MDAVYKLIKQFKNKMNAMLPMGTKSPITTNEYISKLNKRHIQELLIQEYSTKFLYEIKNELEATYLVKRAQERAKTAHTTEHQEIVESRHTIQEDLEKIKPEINAVVNMTNHIEMKIKQELNLTNKL